jgi:FkbM family methyltransferase
MDSIISALRPLRFRGKYRLMTLFAPKSGVRSASIFGYRMDLDLADWIQRNMYLGSYEQPQTSRILSHLRPGMTFVDVGANVGYYSAMASSIVGDVGRVISCDPNPYSFDRLSGWIQANQAKNITPVCVALGGEEGTLTTHFADADNHTASLVHGLLPSETRETTVVAVKTLDSEAERLGLGHIDVMKIDVDGYESEVFKGSSKLLEEGRIGAILCEFSVHWLGEVGSSSDELERFFVSRGFIQRGVYGTELLGDRWFVRA